MDRKDRPNELDLFEIINVIKNRYITILIVVILSISVTLLVHLNENITPKYSVNYKLKIFGSYDNDIIRIIEEFSDHIQSESNVKFDKEFISKIIWVRGSTLRTERGMRKGEFNTKESIYGIEVVVTDTSIIDTLSNELIKYINNHEMIKERQMILIKLAQARRDKLSDNISMLGGVDDDKKSLDLHNSLDLIDHIIEMINKGVRRLGDPLIKKIPSQAMAVRKLVVAGVLSLFIGISIALIIEWLPSNR